LPCRDFIECPFVLSYQIRASSFLCSTSPGRRECNVSFFSPFLSQPFFPAAQRALLVPTLAHFFLEATRPARTLNVAAASLLFFPLSTPIFRSFCPQSLTPPLRHLGMRDLIDMSFSDTGNYRAFAQTRSGACQFFFRSERGPYEVRFFFRKAGAPLFFFFLFGTSQSFQTPGSSTISAFSSH